MIHVGWAIRFIAWMADNVASLGPSHLLARARQGRNTSGSSPRVNRTSWEGGEKPEGGWGDFSESLSGLIGSIPWTAQRMEKLTERREQPSPEAEEGRVKTQQSSWDTSEGRRSGEHRPGRGVTPVRQERTLRRINALKSTPWLTRCHCGLPVGSEVHTG